MTIKRFFLTAACLFATRVAGAPSATPGLEGAIREIWSASPQLHEFDVQIGLADRDRWRRFLPNEPRIAYGKDESDQSRTFGVELGLGFPGKAFAYTDLDSALARKQRFDKAAKKSELATLMTQAYMECASAQATIEIREGALSDLEALLSSLKARRGIIQTEKLSFELETRQARQDLLTARDAKDVSCQKLRALLGSQNSILASLDLPEDLSPSVLNELGSQTPEENRARGTIEVADANYGVARWAQMPDFTLDYGRKQTFDPSTPGDPSHWSNYYAVSVTLPILYPFYESAETKRARSQAILDKSDILLQKNQLDADRAEAARSFLRNREYLKELNRKDLPLGQQLLESSYAAYRSGQIGHADMVLSRRTLIDLKLKAIELRTAIVTARLKCLDLCETKPAAGVVR